MRYGVEGLAGERPGPRVGEAGANATEVSGVRRGGCLGAGGLLEFYPYELLKCERWRTGFNYHLKMILKSSDMTNNLGQDPSRTISQALAPIVQQLELRGARVVTLDDIKELRPRSPDSSVRRAILELVRRGWLRPLHLRGAYEFIPGAAAGRYPSGDPWIELRAALRLQPQLKVQVGFSSAAWLRGYMSRAPRRHIVVVARYPKAPPALEKTYTLIRTSAPRVFGAELIEDIPVASRERIFVDHVWRPDVPDLAASLEWLSRLIADVDESRLVMQLRQLDSRSAWARAGYLAELTGQNHVAEVIEAEAPSLTGPYYLGPSGWRGTFLNRWSLYDNLGLRPPRRDAL